MLQLSAAGKRFGPKLLFEDANWLITPDERTGLVGGNGTGKSTLLKVLAGLETLDYGQLTRVKGMTLGYLPQDGLALRGKTVFEECLSVFDPIFALEREAEEITHTLSTADPKSPLLPLNVAVERIAAARRAIDEAGGDTLLVGRAENFVAGVPDLEDAIARLRAYAQAGADCLYAPGINTREQIEAVVAAVRPKPVNLLIGGPSAFTLDELTKLGVRRVSVGGALARAAWGGLVTSVQGLADGRFDSLPKEPSGGWLNSMFNDVA